MRWYHSILESSPSSHLCIIDQSRILVIEDDLCLQTALTRLVRDVSPRIEVVWATTADEVHDSLLEGRDSFDLVISDILLPGSKSGVDLWRAASRFCPRQPFLLMSGMSTQEYLNLVGEMPRLPRFLPKPFTGQECREAIESLLRLKAA